MAPSLWPAEMIRNYATFINHSRSTTGRQLGVCIGTFKSCGRDTAFGINGIYFFPHRRKEMQTSTSIQLNLISGSYAVALPYRSIFGTGPARSNLTVINLGRDDNDHEVAIIQRSSFTVVKTVISSCQQHRSFTVVMISAITADFLDYSLGVGIWPSSMRTPEIGGDYSFYRTSNGDLSDRMFSIKVMGCYRDGLIAHILESKRSKTGPVPPPKTYPSTLKAGVFNKRGRWADRKTRSITLKHDRSGPLIDREEESGRTADISSHGMAGACLISPSKPVDARGAMKMNNPVTSTLTAMPSKVPLGQKTFHPAQTRAQALFISEIPEMLKGESEGFGGV
ncbi:uncharacterized protein BT62DRAFT_1011346 [Guyanagaster necrorhizus]|uniref:Uncharacterized protein n=1 Tax=Guyanagaster necrorhizus TaxID=856835 RepID=A0A9P7VKR1_9AGAR|nr:uncharacterized protein BT62DRAFT_1011346 [Guyanagaster necrorhizus MCA 3950]KAG7441761.1 hypothetical protein BT62DRAFT_1011346 [Guyanagaster necrorhizus MCA 3950]